MEVFLEILKLTIPSFAVVAVVYFMLREYFESEHKRAMLEIKTKQQNTTLPIRLGAYERLSLFCERISIPALILRVRVEGTTAQQLRLGLLIAIQQEFEHNITQQVYVSDNLWKIIKIARDDVQNTIDYVYQSIDPDADAKEYAKALFEFLEKKEVLPLHKAQEAVKKEASLLL
ncbi:MAG TPA: hypothetical protein ENJ53_06065 [Phaeodactylibacter sp.]|nr:hypothetical protein [Phaeodactylibacter sp.]